MKTPRPIVAPVDDGITSQLVEVTPELAERWLGSNTHNRNIRPNLVDAYARDMAGGRWLVNGEAIKFSAANVLLDGQHRLLAVAKSGATITALVVRGLPESTQETMDAGARRTAGDALRLRGAANYSTTAAVARKALMWSHGQRTFDGAIRPTNVEIVAFAEANADVYTAAEIASHYRNQIPAAVSVSGLCYWLFARIDARMTDEFYARLATGADLYSGHPVLTLRNRLVDLRGPGRSVADERVTAMFIRTWNAVRSGRTLERLQITTGRGDDKFPEPR